MQTNNPCHQAIEQYYQSIYRYCLRLLPNDIPAAQDCCQNVFLLLLEKQSELDFENNIRGWLYACADRIVKDYKKTAHKTLLIGDAIAEAELVSTFPFEELEQEHAFQILEQTEFQLLQAYYKAQYGTRMELAKQYGMTPAQLYQEVHKIRKKVIRAKNIQE